MLYGKECFEWCKKNTKDYLKKASEAAIFASMLTEYVYRKELNTAIISTQSINAFNDRCSKEAVNMRNEYINGVPVKYIMKEGKYFEIKPGVWYLIVTTEAEYYAYKKYINQLSYYESSYDSFLEDNPELYNIYGDKLCKDLYTYCKENSKDTLRFGYLRMLYRMVTSRDEYSTAIVDKETAQELRNKSESNSLIYLRPGLYVECPDVGLRRLVVTIDELEEYDNYLCNLD